MYRIGKAEIDAVARVISQMDLSRVGSKGKRCEKFEAAWAEKIGTKYALLMCGGGTAALTCSLAGLGIGPGDEVIVPAYTWLASATCVLTVGAIPVLAEIDETLGLDPDDFERRIGPRTKAVIPVHMVGRPADLSRICAIAKKRGVKVVEDACQMVGGTYKGKRVGSWGDAGAFSFNFFKIISCGEGGAMVTDDRTVYETAFIFHDSGSAFRPKAAELSVPLFVAQQYRADEIMAAIMLEQLKRMDRIIADLQKVRRRLEKMLSDVKQFRIAPSNDPDGDCGVILAIQFDDAEKAQRFNEKMAGRGYLGINHGKHVYTNWTQLKEKRVMHHPRMNPFNFEENRTLRADYSERACPRTLDILRRTYILRLDPDWTKETLEELAAACISAAGSI